METLQKMAQQKPQPMSACSKEAYSYAGPGQVSPVPGETASPQSYLQHSPSLPASGLTEFNDEGSMTWHTLPGKTQELHAVRRDLTTGTLRKQYVGVRVKMPVRELLRKVRLSKGTDPNNNKETSVKEGIKRASGTTGKKRAYSEKQNKNSRHRTQAALKSIEDLDILVEVLEEDLNESHSKLGFQLAIPGHQDGSAEFQPPCWEADGSPQAESSWEPVRFQPRCPFFSAATFMLPNAEDFNGLNCRMIRRHLKPGNTFQNSCEEEGHQQGEGSVVHPLASFQGFARDMSMPLCCNPSGHAMPGTLEDSTAIMYDGGQLKPTARSFVKQDSSAISFFQFQLCHEESRLRSISVDRLLVPDKNGNGPLHVAVKQGKRALTYVLAWRFAFLNRIDEKDAAKQTALHLAAQNNHHLIAGDLISLGASVNAKDGLEKTPLHLCAEKGYVRVLEVLRNCQERGIHVEVDSTDNQGLTPLQSAALAHSTLSMDLRKRHLSPEVQKVQGLRKEQILNGINCLVQMGADPWVQGAKCSSQASSYFAKVQEDNELMSVFHIHRPKWQKDLVPGPEGTTLLYLQGEDVQPLMPPFLSFFEHFPEGAV